MPKTNPKIEINEQFRRALELMAGEDNIFVTGKAGTGKSTLLNYFRSTTKKKIVVLAPTGVAAINVTGQTIHSFFRFKPDITLFKVKKRSIGSDQENIYKALDAIVIDEISMVRADLLDCADKFMRLNGRDRHRPFGGAQMIFIGDLYQIPPVVAGAEKLIFNGHYASPYFFDSNIFHSPDFKMQFLELDKIYRQRDDKFIRLLNSIRNRSATVEDLAALNARHLPDFVPSDKVFYIRLTTTNDMAQAVNEAELKKLKGREYMSPCRIVGRIERASLPTAEILKFKIGAQIMLLNNDAMGRWVNGTIGRIIDIEESEDPVNNAIIVKLDNGRTVDVSVHTWELFQYKLQNGRIESEVAATFTQYPFKLAYAITIHKSQGKTFDKVIIDLGRGTFAHGQLYVALSRCTALEGLVLKQPIKLGHIRLDYAVMKFLTGFQYEKSEEALPLEEKIKILKEAAKAKRKLKILYLKAKDEKSERIFNAARILEIKECESI